MLFPIISRSFHVYIGILSQYSEIGNPKNNLKKLGIPIDILHRNAYNQDVPKRYTKLTHKSVKEHRNG